VVGSPVRAIDDYETVYNWQGMNLRGFTQQISKCDGMMGCMH